MRSRKLPSWALGRITAVGMLLGLFSAQAVMAQAGLYAYPRANQSKSQQQQDRYECHEWSVGQTGYDPNRPPQPAYSGGYAPPPPSQGGYFGQGQAGQGGVVRDAGGGALLGALGGAIAGNAGKGAAIGAISGTLFGGIRRSSRNHEQQQYQQQMQAQQQQQQQQQQAQMAQMENNYRRAWSACMRGRSYGVE